MQSEDESETKLTASFQEKDYDTWRLLKNAL